MECGRFESDLAERPSEYEAKMTTVAWRGGYMAADSLLVRGGGIKGTATKIHRVGDYVIGTAGTLMDCVAFVRWWQDRDRPLDFRAFRNDGSDAPDLHALVAGPDGVEVWTEHLQPVPVETEFYAIGSGAMAAMAAMYMGASAAEAVRIASLVDQYTGGEIQVLEVTSGCGKKLAVAS